MNGHGSNGSSGHGNDRFTETATAASGRRSPSDGHFAAVIFDEAVVTDSADLHAAAWREVFEYALPLIAGTDDVAPFRNEDYYTHIDGRSAEEAVRTFLASRGLRLPVGHAEDPPETLTIQGLLNRKQYMSAAFLSAHGVVPYPSTVALLRQLRSAGIATAVVSPSRDVDTLLAASGTACMFSTALGLSGEPEADAFREAARRLSVPPRDAVVIGVSEASVRAAKAGGFGRVIAVDRGGNRRRLSRAEADVVVSDLTGTDVAGRHIGAGEWCVGADLETGPWLLTFTRYEPVTESFRETLCTLANGYWGTRGAAPNAVADGIHYPGTYLAGVYNRLDGEVAGRSVSVESIVNAPNWLAFSADHADGHPIDCDHGTLITFRQELDLRRGLLTRVFVHRDPAGRTTRITERRLVSRVTHHVAAMETTIEALDWSGGVHVHSGLDANVANTGIAEAQHLANRHLLPVAAADHDGILTLEVITSQSRVHIALAARTRVHRGGDVFSPPSRTVRDVLMIGHELNLHLAPGQPVTIEKVVAVATSRDRAISAPAESAGFHLRQTSDFSTLLAAHERAWGSLWDDFAMPVVAGSQIGLALHLYTFHVLQTIADAESDVDASVGARGLHGEGYGGHVFWDETFVFPMLTLRRPELTRALLSYRCRRLRSAQAAAANAGLPGALYPWQSGSDGRELTPALTFNYLSGQWLADTSHRQRHVGLAVAYSIIQYHQATADAGFLAEMGGEVLVEICRLFAAMATPDPADGRFHIDDVMGPDEFHDGYPGRAGSGVRDNAYINILTAWLLHRTISILELIDRHDCGRLRRRLDVSSAEITRWRLLSRRLAVPWHRDGVISQFDGYEALPEFDWAGYRARYASIERLDLILNVEGNSANNYRISKQADVLMLFYLLSAEELREVLERLGYPLTADTIRSTVDFYTARTSHGSTLSRIVHAWVNARADRHRAWSLFTEAIGVDLAEAEGRRNREGVHLGAMAGTVDLITRCFGGLETRDDALWIHPALPPELARAEFTVVYRGQRIAVELTPRRVVLRLQRCAAQPITVCIEGERTGLGPGDVHVAHLRSANETTPAPPAAQSRATQRTDLPNRPDR